jgi:WD40 repeat protein
MLLTSSDDRTVKMWDSRTGTKMSSLEGAVKAVMCVAFSNDGSEIRPARPSLSPHFRDASSWDVSSPVWGHVNLIACL